jgi:hypothetical protein
VEEDLGVDLEEASLEVVVASEVVEEASLEEVVAALFLEAVGADAAEEDHEEEAVALM